MIVKIFKTVWFLSLVATVGVFLYVYASLPAEIQITDGSFNFTVTRDGLFYTVLFLLALLTGLALMASKVYREKMDFFKLWFYGLITFVHLFLVVALQFINLYSSNEKFDYASIGYIIYGSMGMVAVWLLVLPIYFFSTRIFNKPAV